MKHEQEIVYQQCMLYVCLLYVICMLFVDNSLYLMTDALVSKQVHQV